MVKKRITTYLEEELWENLSKLSETTRVPMARYIQEAIEDLMQKYEKESSLTK